MMMMIDPVFFHRTRNRYGIEGIVRIHHETTISNVLTFDAEQNQLTYQEVPMIYLFRKVIVQISVDESQLTRSRLILKLVDPIIPGFSVSSLKKRKG
jgi:hypothetical protein